MLAVLAKRTYRHLFAAQVIALLGTGLLIVARLEASISPSAYLR